MPVHSPREGKAIIQLFGSFEIGYCRGTKGGYLPFVEMNSRASRDCRIVTKVTVSSTASRTLRQLPGVNPSRCFYASPYIESPSCSHHVQASLFLRLWNISSKTT